MSTNETTISRIFLRKFDFFYNIVFHLTQSQEKILKRKRAGVDKRKGGHERKQEKLKFSIYFSSDELKEHAVFPRNMPYFQGTFEERCLTTGAPPSLALFTMILSILFLITNIPSHLLVITAVLRDPHKNLRSPFNILMANLSAADLIVGAIVCPLSIHYHLKEALRETISITQIKIFHLSYYISCTASVLSLASLAIERHLAMR